MKFLFKYPTMGRPEWFKETIQKYISMLSGEHEYLFVITLNYDDETMNNKEIWDFIDCLQTPIEVCYGYYSDKISAINDDVKGRNFDILFLISDDMIPQIPGFDLIIAEDMETNFKGRPGALHYPDGCCNNSQDGAITLTIMNKKLYDYFGYIYHPDYKSFYCDNEFADVARRLNACVFIDKVIVKHEWSGGKNGDEVYKRNTKLGKGDQATYERRKAAGFPR